MIRRDSVFDSDGLTWSIEQESFTLSGQEPSDWVAYAICSNKRCRVKLDFSQSNDISCKSCGRKYFIEINYETLRQEVNEKYQGSKFWESQVINLDLLPTKVSSENEDSNYKIIAKLGQKDGKRAAVVYILDRTQIKGEKVQFFIDVDDEMIRFDKDDKHPMRLLAKVQAEFLGSKHVILKKDKVERK